MKSLSKFIGKCIWLNFDFKILRPRIDKALKRNMKKLLFILICGCLFGRLLAQTTDADLYADYLSGNVERWREAIAEPIEASEAAALRRLNYEYGYIGYCVSVEKMDEALRVLNLAKKHAEQLKTEAMANLYRSAFAAFELKITKSNYIKLGMRSVKYANLAFEQAPKNPYVLALKGNTDFYRPTFAGGSKTRAIEYYEEAVRQFETQKLTKNNWNYIAALLNLAQAYEKTDNQPKAKQIYQKIKRLAPDFNYLK